MKSETLSILDDVIMNIEKSLSTIISIYLHLHRRDLPIHN